MSLDTTTNDLLENARVLDEISRHTFLQMFGQAPEEMDTPTQVMVSLEDKLQECNRLLQRTKDTLLRFIDRAWGEQSQDVLQRDYPSMR